MQYSSGSSRFESIEDARFVVSARKRSKEALFLMIMFPSTTISTSTISEPSVSSETRTHHEFSNLRAISPQTKPKKKRTKPGNPDPGAEVVALSPRSLLITNRFVCEICNKGFQRDQNLQLHRRGHNLPWCLRQRTGNEAARKRVYVCPEPSCVHHHPSRALGDLTGIKKHFCRKHGEKKWKCDKCFKKYAVFSDWKAHAKTCGTREYTCHCGILFSRKDSFVTHRAFCDALAEESARMIIANSDPIASTPLLRQPTFPSSISGNWVPSKYSNPNHVNDNAATSFNGKQEDTLHPPFNPYLSGHHLHSPSAAIAAPHLLATTLLQEATPLVGHRVDRLTRNFLGVDMPGHEELLPMHGLSRLDLVTTGSVDIDGRGGGHADPLVGFGFAPAAGAWGWLLN